MSKIIMSQSLAKSLYDYKQGKECGLIIKAKWVDGIAFPSTDPMDLGNYFEFICTGQIPRDGQIPQPKSKKSGEYYTDYNRVHVQVQNFKNLMNHYGFELIETGTKLQTDELGGILDILAFDKNNNKKAIIDLKYTALLNDKWSDTGWSEESIELKDKIHIQAVQYKLLWRQIHNEDIDFYFFVFSSKNETEFRIYKVEIDEDAYSKHIKNMKMAALYFENEIKNGFTPLPSYDRCKKCYLKDKCQSKLDFPEIKTVYYAY